MEERKIRIMVALILLVAGTVLFALSDWKIAVGMWIFATGLNIDNDTRQKYP